MNENKEKIVKENEEKIDNHSSSLLSIKQVAHKCGVSEHTVRRWINRGILPSIKWGKKMIRIKPGALQMLIDSGY